LITAPLILVNFHVVSPIAIVLNLLLWPFLLVALLSGLGVLLLGTWLPPLGMVFGGICTGALASMQWMIDVAVDVPGGHVWLASPGGWWLIVFYGCFAVFCLFVGLGPQRKRVLALLLLILFLAGLTPGLFGPRGKYPLLASPDDGGLSVTFVDVGHGTSVIIELPDGKTVLYDAGRMGSGERSHLAIAEALWHADVGRVHTAFLSHADADHFNGLAGIAKRFPIETLATTQSVVDKSNSELSAALDAVTDTGAGLRLWTKGDRQQIGGVNFTALHPADDSMAVGDNALSLCLLIEFAGRRIFLPGDLESLGMTELLLGSPVDVDILMAAHHGSLAESPFPLLQWCQPEWIAVSGGKRTAQLRVVHAFEQTGGEVLTTYEYGAVRFEIERGGRLMVKHWAGEDWENVTQGGKFNASGSGVELAF
jgi:competence protein ComEC